MTSTTFYSNSLIPSDLDVSMAKESSRLLDELHLESDEALNVEIRGKSVSLPAGIARMLMGTLHEVAEGKSIAVVQLDEELTPNEAADFLLVSRPYVMKLIEQGELPARKVGTHYRIKLSHALTYREKNDADRRDALAELVALAQESDMGY